jgi:RimJ/RimL family protein N-acetyltransferase
MRSARFVAVLSSGKALSMGSAGDGVKFSTTPPEKLSDGVIRLDGFQIADAEAHWLGEDDEMRLRFEAPRRATLAETQAAMLRWIEAWTTGGPMFAYAVRRHDGLLVGGCELRCLAADRANVSYWIFPRFRGEGYAARALILLVQAACAIRGLQSLEAHIDVDNIASRNTASRAGFVAMGTVVDVSEKGAPVERLLYICSTSGSV